MALEYASARSAARQRRRALSAPQSLLRRLDPWLLVTTIVLIAYGLWLLAGITRDDTTDPNYYVIRQGIFVAVGFVGFLIMVAVDPAFWRRWSRAIYAALLGAILLVYVAGPKVRGSHRWFDVGFGFKFQPSELGKVALIVFLAAFVANRGRDTDGRGLIATIGLGLIPVGLVFLQPDFGTALVYMAALTAVLFFAGTRWLHLGILAAVTVLTALMVLWWLPAAGLPVLKPYQQQRLTNFLHPNHDPQGATYNQTQAQIAVGAGGTSGRGVCATASSTDCATQTTLNFLPEHHTDFAFASVSEQRGFLGAIFLLLLYLLVVWRGLKTVSMANDSFSAIVAGAIVVAFLFQVFVNIGMTIGIAPITGIPLPFVSYGGSAVVSNLLALGLLQAIHARGRRRW